jgi:serine/threonine-protein kinase RsbW
MTNGSAVRLDVRSSLDMLDLVQAVCDRVGRAAGLGDDAMHWVDVAVRESVINAITHGNHHDHGKRVHIEFTLLEDSCNPGIAIRVRDEGLGFDPGCLPDCCAPENLLRTSGRGIFLIRSFMDELVLRRAPEGGMEVVMVKHAQPPAGVAGPLDT